MLGGLSPVLIFKFLKAVDGTGLSFTVPVYLDEGITGIGQMSESKSSTFSREKVGKVKFIKSEGESVTLRWVGSNKATGIVVLINLIRQAIKKMDEGKDAKATNYYVSYFSPTTIISKGYISDYRQDMNNESDKLEIEFTIEDNIEEEEEATTVSIFTGESPITL